MVDRRMPVPVARRKNAAAATRQRTLPHVYRGRAGRLVTGLYDDDHAEPRQEGRFRWLVSTCLGAAVGAAAILVVIYGSSDPKEPADGFLPALRSMGEQLETEQAMPTPQRLPGLAWAAPRSDRLVFAAGALSTRYMLQDPVKQRRAGRDYIKHKPYTRVVARLAPVASENVSAIPAFNPFKLYSAAQPVAGTAETGAAARTDVTARVVELLGGILPNEDGQELEPREIAELIAKAARDETPLDDAGGAAEALPLELASANELTESDAAAPFTTDISKSSFEEDAGEDLPGGETRTVKVGQGDTLELLLTRAGAEKWHAREMIEAASTLFPERLLAAGQEVRIALAPSPIEPGRMEPIRFSVVANNAHLVTVSRNAGGQFVARADRSGEASEERLSVADTDLAQASSVYASVFYAARQQNITPETILNIMRVHAYETDFRRKVRPGDSAEFFFDTKEGASIQDPPGELLYTSITAGDESRRFYRFRSADGSVDFFDENGNNSKRFLMRKPVRSSEVRYVSGFGLRFHPLLNVRKMHTGVDWASPIGTPIMAAGNGVIEESGYKGGYGNYVRIRHANGYRTAYAHLSKFAAETKVGAKVRQGQPIGAVGCTGLCQGPHLHFEVLVNNQFVDPLSIQVPNERQLKGRELLEFNKERERIDQLMRLPPTQTVSK